jgi:hypothetical protein
MPVPSSLLQTVSAKFHTIHPAIILPLVGVAAWLITPVLVMGDGDKPGPGKQIATTDGGATGNSEAGAAPAGTGAQSPYSIIGAATAAPSVPSASGLLSSLFGGGASSGNTGGGGGGFADGGSGQSKPPASRAPAATGTPPTRPAPAPMDRMAKAETPLNAPAPANNMPRTMPAPGAPPAVTMQRPIVPAAPPPLIAHPAPPPSPQAAPAPAPARPPLLFVPFAPQPFFRSPIIRGPVIIARGGRR